MNAAFESLSGYSREEIEGKKSWIEFVAEEDQPRLKRYYLLHRIDPGTAPDTFEFKFTRRDGNTRDVVVYLSFLPGSRQQSATLLDLAGYKKPKHNQHRLRRALYRDRVISPIMSWKKYRQQSSLQTWMVLSGQLRRGHWISWRPGGPAN